MRSYTVRTMDTSGLPDMYTLRPAALGFWVYISGKPQVDMV